MEGTSDPTEEKGVYKGVTRIHNQSRAHHQYQDEAPRSHAINQIY